MTLRTPIGGVAAILRPDRLESAAGPWIVSLGEYGHSVAASVLAANLRWHARLAWTGNRDLSAQAQERTDLPRTTGSWRRAFAAVAWPGRVREASPLDRAGPASPARGGGEVLSVPSRSLAFYLAGSSGAGERYSSAPPRKAGA